MKIFEYKKIKLILGCVRTPCSSFLTFFIVLNETEKRNQVKNHRVKAA